MVEKTLLIRQTFEDTITEIVVDGDTLISQMNDRLSIRKVDDKWIAIDKIKEDYLKELIKECINEFWEETSQKFKKSSWK